jgi:hypothetical protein
MYFIVADKKYPPNYRICDPINLLTDHVLFFENFSHKFPCDSFIILNSADQTTAIMNYSYSESARLSFASFITDE